MPIEPTTQEQSEATASLKRYFATELEMELSDLRAKLLLDFLLKEIGPLAYNRGVQDAEKFFRARLEDLSATCFEPPFRYWRESRRR